MIRHMKVVWSVALLSLCMSQACSDEESPIIRDPSQEDACKVDLGPPQDCYVEDVLGKEALKIYEYDDLVKFCTTACSKIRIGTSGLTIAPQDVKDLSPLRSLREIPAGLSLGPRNLASLDGLQLASIGSFRMDYNGVEDLSALTNTRIENLIEIRFTQELKSLRGLEGARDLTKYARGNNPLVIEQIKGIRDLKGLDGLEAVGARGMGAGIITRNDNLMTLDGLQSLRRGRLHVTLCPKLTDISALMGFEEGDLVFADNKSLPACQIERLRQAVAGRDVTITARDNGPDDPALCPR